MDKAENVLLSGCSAGGIGTFGNTDWVYDKLTSYNSKINYKAAPIAGWFWAGNCTDEQSPGKIYIQIVYNLMIIYTFK